MALRIIGGKFKSRKIEAPSASITRPTSGLLRETFFNIVNPYIQGVEFLDIFAGSGAIGLEAISRGADKAIFIEKNRSSAKIIKNNIELLAVQNQTELYILNALSGLNKLIKLKSSFDIIFADPPYDKAQHSSLLLDILQLIDTSFLLKKSGVLFLETNGFVPNYSDSLQSLFSHDKRKIGDSFLFKYQFLKEV